MKSCRENRCVILPCAPWSGLFSAGDTGAVRTELEEQLTWNLFPVTRNGANQNNLMQRDIFGTTGPNLLRFPRFEPFGSHF
jgi:hypothetical protein